LRERRDEIEPMARLFLANACRDWNLEPHTFTPEALEALRSCNWPGNVRQLRYTVERAALLAASASITLDDLPEHVSVSRPRVDTAGPQAVSWGADLGLKQHVKRYERLLLDEALRRAGGNRQGAAKLLRIPLRTLFRKLRAPGSTQSEEAL
jgi:DNA-binding NtrC family response regulator